MREVKLDETVAVITGATGGVGQAVARRIASYADVVCLIGRDPEKLTSVCRAVEGGRSRLIPLCTDFTRDSNLELLVHEMEPLSHIDILVHCAGAINLADVASSRIEDFDMQYQVNVRAPFVLTRAWLPKIKRREGQIVFVNSTAGLEAHSQDSQYAATKHALRAVADSLREEVNANGVRVLTMFIGRTASPMQEFVHKQERKSYWPDRLIQPNDVATMILHALNLPRTAEVTEIRMRPMLKPIETVEGFSSL